MKSRKFQQILITLDPIYDKLTMLQHNSDILPEWDKNATIVY